MFLSLQTKIQFICRTQALPINSRLLSSKRSRNPASTLESAGDEAIPASYPPAWHACWLQQALAQEKKPGHIQVAIFPELSWIHLDPISCQMKCRFCLFSFSPPRCLQPGPGPDSFCSVFLTGHSTSFRSAGLFPNHPSSVLTISEAWLGSCHCLLRSCQCLPVLSGLNTTCLILTCRANLHS